MSLLRMLVEKRAVNIPESWLKGYGWETAAGVSVTPEDSMKFSAVWACVRVLAETIASLPLMIYRKRADGGKERVTNHPLYRVLHDQANSEMTSFQWREVGMTHLCTWGNLYSQIILSRGGDVAGLYPLFPDRMSVIRDEKGELVYKYRLLQEENGKRERTFSRQEILHIPGLGYNGVIGYSPIQMARQSIGLGLAAEEFGSRFFSNGARPGGVLEYPKGMDDKAFTKFKTRWDETHQGLDQSHSVAILEDGMTYKSIGIPPEDAQFLQTRKFQIQEIARIYRVPPHMLADLDRATFSNIEHQSIEFVVHTVRPWLVRWEQALNSALLTELERKTYFVEYLVDGLLRGDTQARYGAYSIGRNGGWLSVNDIRGLENLNPIPGGDEYLVPLNMKGAKDDPLTGTLTGAPAGGAPAGEDEEETPFGDEKNAKENNALPTPRSEMGEAMRALMGEALGRVLRREAQDTLKGERIKDKGERGEWLDEFYVKHNEWAQRSLIHSVKAEALLFGVKDEGRISEVLSWAVKGMEAETRKRIEAQLEMGAEIRLEEVIEARALEMALAIEQKLRKECEYGEQN